MCNGNSCRLGLPEVLIGILPGLGGTQRLPRLVGLEKAIDIITTGRHVRVKEALQIGLIDKVSVFPITYTKVYLKIKQRYF